MRIIKFSKGIRKYFELNAVQLTEICGALPKQSLEENAQN